MTDQEKLRAEAVESFPRWSNLAHYVVDDHEIAAAMRWARDTEPQDLTLILALDALDDAQNEPLMRQFALEVRARDLYREARATEGRS